MQAAMEKSRVVDDRHDIRREQPATLVAVRRKGRAMGEEAWRPPAHHLVAETFRPSGSGGGLA